MGSNSNIRAFFMKTTFLLLFLYSSNLFAFSSITGYIPPKGRDVHAQITSKAVMKFGFSYISFKHLMAGNVSHDFYEKMINKADYHCDRNKGVTNTQVARGCKKAAYDFLRRAANYVKNGKALKGLHFLGKSLHILQDFISHSNYVDLNKKDKALALRFILNKTKKIPQSLKFTGWDAKVEKGEVPGLLKGDFYPHDHFAKDSVNQNKESSIKLKSYGGKTKYQASFDEAVNISTAVIEQYKSKFKDDLWEFVILTNHFR